MWKSNLAFIQDHNKEADKHGYSVGMNAYGDLTSEEFAQFFNGYKMLTSNSTSPTFKADLNLAIPDQVDWREKGAVSPVRNQGQCGSSSAFSAIDCLEGQVFLKTGHLVPLSLQNLIDCCHSAGENGCNGGPIDEVFKCIQSMHGVDTEESYPE